MNQAPPLGTLHAQREECQEEVIRNFELWAVYSISGLENVRSQGSETSSRIDTKSKRSYAMPRHMYVFERHPDFSSEREIKYQAWNTPRFGVSYSETIYVNMPIILN